MRKYSRILAFLAVAVLLPTAVHAQSITGSVKDASGAVLPGVTVEVSSPALIEKVRTVVTDGVGQYRVVNLRPGIYSATFTLSGFSIVKRQDIEPPAAASRPEGTEANAASAPPIVSQQVAPLPPPIEVRPAPGTIRPAPPRPRPPLVLTPPVATSPQ